MAMYIQRIDHIQLAMPPKKESMARAFYRDILGIPEKPKPDTLAKRGGVWFEQDSLKIHLGVEADFRPARKAHPAFEVINLAGLVQQCRAAGYEVVDDNEPLANYNRVFIYDPFGNRLEFMEAKRNDHDYSSMSFS